MSEVGTTVVEPKPESTLIQQDGAIPETVIPPEPVEEPVLEAEKEGEKPQIEPVESEKPKRIPWY